MSPTGTDRPTAAVAVDEVTVRFGDVVAVDGVTFAVPEGQVVALVGPSGAGKTTLLRLLSGDLAPTAGAVRVLGDDLATLSPGALRHLRRRVGHLYQSDALVPGLRAVHNVLIGRVGRWSFLRALWSLLWPQEVDVAAAALRRVGIEDKLDAPIATLSGGQRQRVALARLLVQEPRLVLADEPAAALDPVLARETTGVLIDLVRRDRRTALVSLHQLELVDDRFDRVLALHAGRVAYDGPPAQFDAATRTRVFGVMGRLSPAEADGG